jgi:hypothetical protein
VDSAAQIEAKYRVLASRLDEATLRLWAAAEARSLGRGGVSVVAKAAGLSRTTVYAGLNEIDAAGKAKRKGRSKAAAQPQLASARKRIRAPGGGRKKLVDIDASPTFRTCCDAITRNYRCAEATGQRGGGGSASMSRSVSSSHSRSSALTWR